MKNLKHPKIKKLFILMMLFGLVLSAIHIALNKFYFTNHTQSSLMTNATFKATQQQKTIDYFVSNCTQTLFSIQKLEQFKQYFTQNKNRKDIEALFFSIANTNNDIMQLRYIDQNGKEQIRIDRNNPHQEAFVVDMQNLQEKQDRYYFYDSKNKPYNKVWFSALDLNIEHDKIEVPYKPTLRAVLPLEKKSQFGGILIINYFTQNLLDTITDMPMYNAILFNNNGHTLLHHNKEFSWGYYTPHKYNIFSDYQIKDQLEHNKIYITNNYLAYGFQTPFADGLNMILLPKQTYLDNETKNTNHELMVTFISIMVFTIVLSFLIIQIYSKTFFDLEEITRLNKNMQTASNVAKIAFWEYYPYNESIVWSDGVYDIFEIENRSKKIDYATFLSFVNKEDKIALQKEFSESINEKRVYFIKHKVTTEKNNEKYLQEQATHYFDTNGKHLKTIGSVLDITYNMQIEQELLGKNREQSTLLSLFDVGDNILFRWNNDQFWSIDYVSSNVENLLGYTKEEFLNNEITYIQTIYKDDLQHVIEEVENNKLNENGYFKHDPYRVVSKDGQIKWVLDNTIVVKNSSDQVTHFMGYIVDITEQKELIKELQIQKEEFETIFKHSKDGIAITDLESNYLDCNDEYCNMLDYTKEELLTKSCLGLSPEEDFEKNIQIPKILQQDGYIKNFEKRCIKKDGSIITVSISLALLPDKQRILISAKDISERKILENQAKLASMGEMIGNIAHQWRQPLSIITTSASGLEIKANYDDLSTEEIELYTHSIIQQAEYLSNTIDDFRNFIKTDVSQIRINIKEALIDAVNLTDASRKDYYIELIEKIQDDFIIVGNKNELVQSFINILNNSKDALKNNNNIDEKYLFIDAQLQPNGNYKIMFLDNAGGVNPSIQDKIFEPYFTTKHQSQGTGLGLSLVYKIIHERHLGDIYTFNKTYEYNGHTHTGFCFNITLKPTKS